MGGKQSLNQNSQLSSVNSDILHNEEQLFQMHECCGVQVKRHNKKALTWQENIVKYCQSIKSSSGWAAQVIQIVKNKHMKRNKFIKQFNQLRYLQKQPTTSEKQLSLTPSQLNNFKSNLRKSVLLSYNEVTHPQRPKQSSRIQSIIQQTGKLLNKKSSVLMGSGLYTQQIGNRNSIQTIKKSRTKIKGSRSQLRQSVVNLVDDAMTSIFKGQEKQISKLSAHALQIFIKFTVMLEKHLTDPEHKICQIIQCFYNHLYKKYSNYRWSKYNGSTPNRKHSGTQSEICALQLQNLIKSINIFVSLLTQIVEDYYNIRSLNQIQQGSNFLISNYENVLTVIIAIIFKNQKFYSFLFNIVRDFHKQKQQYADNKFLTIHGKQPQHFSIKREYCLNNTSVKKFIQDMSSIQSNIQNFVPDQLQSVTQQPYVRCSQALRKLANSRTPIGKMKNILQCAEKITQNIAQFYDTNQMILKSKMLDADQVLSIFCYILSIEKIEDIYSHMFIIQHFATEHQKISMTGYYYSVLTCALQQNYGQFQQQQENHVNIQPFEQKQTEEMIKNHLNSSEERQMKTIKKGQNQKINNQQSNDLKPVNLFGSVQKGEVK